MASKPACLLPMIMNTYVGMSRAGATSGDLGCRFRRRVGQQYLIIISGERQIA